MGWIGSRAQLESALIISNADVDLEGRFVLFGQVVSFLGMGEEFVVGEDAFYTVKGEQINLSKMLNAYSGGFAIEVI